MAIRTAAILRRVEERTSQMTAFYIGSLKTASCGYTAATASGDLQITTLPFFFFFFPDVIDFMSSKLRAI